MEKFRPESILKAFTKHMKSRCLFRTKLSWNIYALQRKEYGCRLCASNIPLALILIKYSSTLIFIIFIILLKMFPFVAALQNNANDAPPPPERGSSYAVMSQQSALRSNSSIASNLPPASQQPASLKRVSFHDSNANSESTMRNVPPATPNPPSFSMNTIREDPNVSRFCDADDSYIDLQNWTFFVWKRRVTFLSFISVFCPIVFSLARNYHTDLSHFLDNSVVVL